ncbi:MAG: hypothetical protein HY762_05065 [Planctomycetes bacterium]|nr:hypothetical protein [Planctomycetota bacterium]
MKYRIVVLLLIALALLPGASCPPTNPNQPIETPEKNLSMFREALEKPDYAAAYFCLSQNTRARYQFNHFKMMFEYTIFGILIKSMLINWDLDSIKYYSEMADSRTARPEEPTPEPVQKARVVLRHWRYPEYKKEFIFVYEPTAPDSTDKGWRVDFTMAGILEMPQEDEDRLFPRPEK